MKKYLHIPSSITGCGVIAGLTISGNLLFEVSYWMAIPISLAVMTANRLLVVVEDDMPADLSISKALAKKTN